MIAGSAWFVLYVVPTVKYPLSPEVLFASGAAGTYQSLLAKHNAVSGLTAFPIAFGFQKTKRRKGRLELLHFTSQWLLRHFSHFLIERVRRLLPPAAATPPRMEISYRGVNDCFLVFT
jgi:hypothetical protein